MSLQFLLAAALISVDPPPRPPASEAAIDAFIAALPAAEPAADAGKDLDKGRLERLVELNPGSEVEARGAFAAKEQCEQASKDKAVADALRSGARRLGDEKLEKLTEFYSGPDYPLFTRLSKLKESEISKAESAELERIIGTYPLHDYFQSMRATEKDMWSADGLAGALLECWGAYQQELTRRGLQE